MHCFKTCENLARVATTIGKLQHLEYTISQYLWMGDKISFPRDSYICDLKFDKLSAAN